jgi:hypothetical protein
MYIQGEGGKGVSTPSEPLEGGPPPLSIRNFRKELRPLPIPSGRKLN